MSDQQFKELKRHIAFWGAFIIFNVWWASSVKGTGGMMLIAIVTMLLNL